jgi:hypothetical protein
MNVWTRKGEVGEVLHEMKSTFLVSKIAGLFPISFTKDSVTAEISVDISMSANITGFICSIVVFCVAVGGFVSIILQPYNTFTDAGDFVVNVVCTPLILTTALVSTAMNVTINRVKLMKVIKKLMRVNEEIQNLERFKRKKKVKRCSNLIYVHLAFLLIFSCCSVPCFAKHSSLVYSVSVHIAKLLGIIMVMQFRKFVNCVKFSLVDICEIMSARLVENSEENGGMHNEKSGKHPVIECSKLSTPAQVSMYDIRELFPDEIAPANSINVIPHERTELNNIVFCRKIYSSLYDSAMLIGSIYGIPILLQCMSDCIGLITTIYFVVILVRQSTEYSEVSDVTETVITNIGLTVVMLGTMFYVSITCHLVTVQLNKIRDSIEKLLLLHPIKKAVLQELQLFSNQTANNRIQFRAFSFFLIDMKMFVTFIASALTYLIVLIQFK